MGAQKASELVSLILWTCSGRTHQNSDGIRRMSLVYFELSFFFLLFE